MTNINLLPIRLQQRLTVERFAASAKLLLFMTILIFGGTSGAAFYQRFQINRQIENLKLKKDEAASAVVTFDTVAAQTEELAAKVRQYNSIVAKRESWPAIFQYLSATIPPDVTLTSVNTNVGESFEITVSGRAATKSSVGLFREKLLDFALPNEQPRVSQVIIATINNDNAGGQNFTQRLEMDLTPQNAP